ncbi:MarR family transcriptional regulator [Streptomyces lucensis]|uniref:MarR family transcriptional regulator n=1 Tax=Streptomyces lucensis TaxID=67319 RepID=UPI00167293BD|nr:MarR family transcriptional regulator [Streptomyces lucensis]
MTATAAESPDVLSGRAPRAPASTSRVRVPLVPEQHDGTSARTLAGRPGTTPPSASGPCDRLEITGSPERGPGAAGRCQARLRLGGRGRAVLAGPRARRQAEDEAVPAAMPAAERRTPLEGPEVCRAAAAARMLSAGSGRPDGAGAIVPVAPATTEVPGAPGGPSA